MCKAVECVRCNAVGDVNGMYLEKDGLVCVNCIDMESGHKCACGEYKSKHQALCTQCNYMVDELARFEQEKEDGRYA